MPVLAVAAALAAVEGSLADGVVEDPKSPDEQQCSSLPVVASGVVPPQWWPRNGAGGVMPAEPGPAPRAG